MGEREIRHRLAQVAAGRLPPDTVVMDGTLFDAFTGEFVPRQSIWIKDGRIAYVGPDPWTGHDEGIDFMDARGKVLLPGLVDAHTHVAYRTGVQEFVRHVIPSGVTTVVTETIELATVVGMEGIQCLVEALRDQPIRFYFTVPPLCGLTPIEEAVAPLPQELLGPLRDPGCLGVGEIYWGNLLVDGPQGDRVRELASMALHLGKRVEGHTAGASGRRLQAYTALGVSSCHEPITEGQVLDRLRLGYWVMIRQGAIRKELEGVKGIFQRGVDPRRLIIATDSMDPEGFLTEGYLDASVRRALELGVPPGRVYQMVTLNAAEHFRLDHLLGAIAPGMLADIVIVPAPDEFRPELVMREGKVIFREGKAMAGPREVAFPDRFFHTVAADPRYIPAPLAAEKVRVMELETRLVTREAIVDLRGPDGRDVVMALAMDRVAGRGSFMGLLKGFGLTRGACGSTMCWDTADMVVVGCDELSIRTVMQRLAAMGGGAVYAIGEEVIAEFPAPLCGVVSLAPMERARDEIRALETALRDNGVRWEKPLLTIDTLGTAAIPHLRITHHGYVRLKDREVLSTHP
ncbi:MAG: adenine deaminase C-terminal domain-containing protein [Thermodesulfobacteriota bacterium]